MSGGIGVSGVHNLGKEIVVPVLDTGFINFAAEGSFSSIAGTGLTWNTPGNALLQDAGTANVFFVSPDTTEIIRAVELTGDPIPLTATIVGVEVRHFKNEVGAGGITDNLIQLVKGGIAQGDNKSVGAAYPTGGEAEAIYGGPSDMWGLSLTPADVNAADFGTDHIADGGIAFGTASINHIQMKIYYTE